MMLTVSNKKDQLLQTALELFAAEGLAVPTAKIAEMARVANGTLFNYFPSKQTLIDELYLSTKREVSQLVYGAGANEADTLREVSFLVWQAYVQWAMAQPLKHRVMTLFTTANALSPQAVAEADEIFKPLHKRIQRGIDEREIVEISIDYLCQIKGAQMNACIAQALKRHLKGKALETHLRTGFDIYWQGVAR
jgi:AcrR family transcriptional regulator